MWLDELGAGQRWRVWGSHELDFRYIKIEMCVGHLGADSDRKLNMYQESRGI